MIQESQGPEEGKQKLVAVRAGVLLSPNYMEVDFNLEERLTTMLNIAATQQRRQRRGQRKL